MSTLLINVHLAFILWVFIWLPWFDEKYENPGKSFRSFVLCSCYRTTEVADRTFVYTKVFATYFPVSKCASYIGICTPYYVV